LYTLEPNLRHKDTII